MKVQIKQTSDAVEPYAVIFCQKIDDCVRAAAETLKRGGDIVTALDGGRILVIEREDLYLIRSEDGRTRLYTERNAYDSSKPLKEFEALAGCMRISKSCIVNLGKLKSFEPHFSGVMQVTLKNGLKDYISRKYLPAMKKYLGL